MKKCLECGSEVPETSRNGYCPKCLLNLADVLTPGTGSSNQAIGDFTQQLPRAFGNYQLIQLLGEGGMGVVFKGLDTKLNRTVALKMLRSGLLASKEEMQRFRAEAHAVARLKHPNIVTVHEIGEHEGRLFFSMDCIQGRSLAEIVGRTPLPPERAVNYAMRIAEAVHYAHTQGVLHRDLKPANVLVDDKDQPHITDFGLAKEIATDTEVTRSGAILGTPSYMSPEQASGRRKLVKETADIYSLGAILYDLLTGRPPFRADTPEETLRQVVDQEPAPLRLLNAKVPRDLETICLKCLAKDPACRYGSARLLAEDLARFMKGESILARRIGPMERTYRWAKRHPTLAALQLAGAVMLGLLGYVAHFSYSDALEFAKAAPYFAKSLAYDLTQIGNEVRDVASNPALVQMVKTQRVQSDLQLDFGRNEVLKLLDQVLQGRVKNFENWLLLDTDGIVLANWTKNRDAKRLFRPLNHRDYFQGATNLAKRYHVSQVYQSESDDNYKIAVSAPIIADGVFVGVLGRMIAYKDMADETARARIVVIGQMDPTSGTTKTNKTKYAILWHPKLDEKRVVPIPDESELRKTLDAVMSDPHGAILHNSRRPTPYRDFADPGKERWVAGFAQVLDWPLIEVYQVRDRVREAEIVGLFVFIPWIVGFGLWLLGRRRVARMQSTGP